MTKYCNYCYSPNSDEVSICHSCKRGKIFFTDERDLETETTNNLTESFGIPALNGIPPINYDHSIVETESGQYSKTENLEVTNSPKNNESENKGIKFCHNCGNKFDQIVNFCSKCGTKVISFTENSSSNPSSSITKSSKFKSKNSTFLILISLVILAIGIFLYSQRSGGNGVGTLGSEDITDSGGSWKTKCRWVQVPNPGYDPAPPGISVSESLGYDNRRFLSQQQCTDVWIDN